MGAAPTAYDEHPALFRGFALAYGIVLAMALQSLRRAWGADPGRRWTVQKTLLALAACVCGARCVAYLGSIDWHLRYYVQHLFNAVVYWSFFSFHSVLLYFLHEFARFNSTGTGKFCSLSFLYPLDVLNRVKPMLIYVNSVVFLYTYFSLCMIHVQPDWAFLPVVIGSMLHAIIYFTLGANFWSYARLFYPRPIPLTGSTTVRVGTTMPAWWLPWFLSLCLFAQAALTVLPLFCINLFFSHFMIFHSSFIVAELAPIVLILGVLQESASNYFVTAAAAA